MGKVILFLSFCTLLFLTVSGIITPDSPAMWMASTTDTYNLLRGALMLVLVVLLVTNPPRSRIFRLFVGLVAIGLASWSLTATYQNQMMLLDSASLLAVSVSMSIVALEYSAMANTYSSKLVDLEQLRLARRHQLAGH